MPLIFFKMEIFQQRFIIIKLKYGRGRPIYLNNSKWTKQSFHRSVSTNIARMDIIIQRMVVQVGESSWERGRFGFLSKLEAFPFDELSVLYLDELAHVNTMIDEIETALELPPFLVASLFLLSSLTDHSRNQPFQLEVYKETTMGRAVPIFRATLRDGHLTPHPSPGIV